MDQFAVVLGRILEMGLFLKILVFFSIIRSIQGYHDNLKFPFMQTAANLAHKPLTKHYDYIIVGGGTAGCPLAATLSRNFSVLLLERGGSPFGNPYVAWMRNFHISLANAEPGSAAETFISTDGVINSRARVLGGGTCINAGFYTRASTDFVSRAGWDGALVNASYPWVERQIVHKPTLVPWQMAVKDGLLNAGVSPYNGFTYDHLYGTKAGGTIFNRRGFRNTAADLLGEANPQKIDVVIRATVKRVIFNTKGRRPNAVGVIFTDDSGREHKALLNQRRESNVIMSAGALGSPQLMMLSGIGPKEVLKKWKIPLVMDQKEVGQGMSDNPMNSVFIPTKKEMAQSLIQIVGITKVGSYIEASSGFGSTNDSIHDCHHGIMSAEIGQLSTIPPKKRSLDAIRRYRKRKSSLPKELFKGAFILEKVEGPLSVGNLTLSSADVQVTPAVTFNYFQHPDDLRRCVEGIRTIEHVAKSQHVVNLAEDDEYTLQMLLNLTVKANINLIPKNTNDTSSLEQFCKDTVLTIWHYHGGCQVDRVVDKDYRVLGADRIRVIDGSTFKSSPGTNPQGTVMMLGRYVGVKILRERLGRRAGV